MRKRRRLGRVDKLYRRSCHERRRRGGGGGSDLFVFNDTIERPRAPGTAHERERERERFIRRLCSFMGWNHKE
jgi:hypothetical protein